MSLILDLQKQLRLSSFCEVLLLGTIPLHDELEAVQQVVASQPSTWRHIHFEMDPGVYVMWNEGWRRAAGRFVTTLNLDDRLRHDALHLKTQYMLSWPECDALSCEVLATKAVVPYAEACNERASFPRTFNNRSGKCASWFSYSDNRRSFFRDHETIFLRAVTFLGGGAHKVKAQNPPHNAPFWRRDLRSWLGKGGQFRPELDPVADAELWHRATVQGGGVCHLGQSLQTYYINPVSHNRRNNTLRLTQLRLLKDEYRAYSGLRILLLADESAFNVTSPSWQLGDPEALLSGDVALLSDELWQAGHDLRIAPVPFMPPTHTIRAPHTRHMPLPPHTTRTLHTKRNRRKHHLQTRSVTHVPHNVLHVHARLAPVSCVSPLGDSSIGCAPSAGTTAEQLLATRADGLLAMPADVVLVAASPRWRCTDVRSALMLSNAATTATAAAATATARRRTPLGLILPAHGCGQLADDDGITGSVPFSNCVAHVNAAPPASQVDALLVWGDELAGTAIASGRSVGSCSLRGFPALKHASVLRSGALLHGSTCVGSLSSAPDKDVGARTRLGSAPTRHAHDRTEVPMRVSKRVQAALYALQSGQCCAETRNVES